jgi:hypothetical protein
MVFVFWLPFCDALQTPSLRAEQGLGARALLRLARFAASCCCMAALLTMLAGAQTHPRGFGLGLGLGRLLVEFGLWLSVQRFCEADDYERF